MGTIRVTPTISIDEDELDETFVRASGPGGQNVNKVSTAVQLRFDARRSPNLPDDVRSRLETLAGSRLTNDGIIIIMADRYRSQERNREDAKERLIDLIRDAAHRPRTRRPTKPTKGSKVRRLDAKKQRGAIKGLRGNPVTD
ncbi:MAG: alternative ribosome rescue aminoacyl-tRNA hydrolase ArfB [Rhodospirillaceae bacterium]